jgi:hypothetical protein
VEGMPALPRGQKRNKIENGMDLILKNAHEAADSQKKDTPCKSPGQRN